MGSQATTAGSERRLSYRFAFTPRWLAFHALMLGLIVLMANFGLWQLDRYREVRATNETVAARTVEPAVPVEAITTEPPESIEWRTVLLDGSYDPAEQVLVRNRSYQGSGGLHVLTPLRLANGSAVLVNRGWIPLQLASAPPPPPDGAVTVAGRVRVSQQRGNVGPRDPAEGDLAEVARVDVPRLQQQILYDLAPFYVELARQAPATADAYPVAVQDPAFDDGPHLSYMAQWWVFSVCAAIGWGVAMRKSARQRARDAAGQDPAPDAPGAGAGALSATQP